jgi:hypothetical protein
VKAEPLRRPDPLSKELYRLCIGKLAKAQKRAVEPATIIIIIIIIIMFCCILLPVPLFFEFCLKTN